MAGICCNRLVQVVNGIDRTFQNLVDLRYKVNNSIFLTLNLDGVNQTGIILPILSRFCKEGFEEGLDAKQIINNFYGGHLKDMTEIERI